MASRAEQKAAARAQREALQSQLASSQARRNRLLVVGGILAGVVVALVVVIAVSSGSSSPSKAQAHTISALLKGIPQSGNTLGNPNARVKITEFGDLVCPVCKDFALTSEKQLIAGEVRSGKANITFRGLETASLGANGSEYAASQIAARAAGLQKRAWNYILLFYAEQQSETTSYVNETFLQGLAKQVPGLNLAQWESDRNGAALAASVSADTQAANLAGWSATPTVIVSGPKGTLPLVDAQKQGFTPTYSQLQQAIATVS